MGILCSLKAANHKTRPSAAPLATGQVWHMPDSDLRVELVGTHLVHYKLIKRDAKRTPMSLSNKRSVEKYLRTNKAVLVH